MIKKAGEFMSKRLFFITILLCAAVSLTACGNTKNIPPPEDTGGVSGNVEVPDSAATTAGTPEASEESPAPDSSETRSAPPAKESGPANNSTAGTTGRQSTPAASGTPSQAPAQPPTTSPAPSASSATATSQPSKPVYTEQDYKDIRDEVRNYAEGKQAVRFIWKDTFRVDSDEVGYYGHPNLTQLSKAAVINELKFHVDLIENAAIACNSPTVEFNVTWMEIDRAIHFFVLYG
jgi:hypothetical protein